MIPAKCSSLLTYKVRYTIAICEKTFSQILTQETNLIGSSTCVCVSISTSFDVEVRCLLCYKPHTERTPSVRLSKSLAT